MFYPYYTVRNGNVTAMSIVNTTSLTKAVKVRFLEGKNGREVLDFNLFLSPIDVWTGVVLPTSDGARLETGDNSCVTPSDLFGDASGVIRNDAAVRPINAFSNSQYTGANVDDPEQNALDRTREGYIEVFEMGIVVDATMTGFIKHAQSGSSLGQPSNCGALDAYEGLSTAALPAVKLPGNYLVSPGGGLTGRASIINSASGINFTIDITALDGWWTPLMPGAGQRAVFRTGRDHAVDFPASGHRHRELRCHHRQSRGRCAARRGAGRVGDAARGGVGGVDAQWRYQRIRD